MIFGRREGERKEKEWTYHCIEGEVLRRKEGRKKRKERRVPSAFDFERKENKERSSPPDTTDPAKPEHSHPPSWEAY